MPAYDNLSIRARRDKANQHVSDLDQCKAQWRMSIPVDSNCDSDEIICASLDDIDYLIAANDKLLARVAELEGKLNNSEPLHLPLGYDYTFIEELDLK